MCISYILYVFFFFNNFFYLPFFCTIHYTKTNTYTVCMFFKLRFFSYVKTFENNDLIAFFHKC